FLFTHPATPPLYTLSLHDALPISPPVPAPDRVDLARGRRALARRRRSGSAAARRRVALHPRPEAQVADVQRRGARPVRGAQGSRSEEHTSELQSRGHLVCRLLLEK